MRIFVLFLALLALPSAARADWLEASSDNFVVIADESEREVREFAERLEKYHSAMEIVTGIDLPPPSPSNRVTVFIVRDVREVQRLIGARGSALAGYYLPRAGRSIAVVPRANTAADEDRSLGILLHEYAHHFLLSNSTFAPPRWLSEGGAEFFAAARFSDDGSLTLGLPQDERYRELAWARNADAEELLDPEVYEKKRRANVYDSFYGKSWLLYHMLIFEEDRRGQLGRYLRLLVSGTPLREAGEQAFGDFADLERELAAYRALPRLLSMRFERTQLSAGEITVRRLGDAAAAIMPVRLQSSVGVNEELAQRIVANAREVAAEHPDDPVVLAALAEAEFDAGNDAEAIAASDRALALDPTQVNAYIQKGYALFRMAQEAEDRAAAYETAVKPFLTLNRLENDHPLPLSYYYRSFVERGVPPPAVAVEGLEHAIMLAPFDHSLRIMAASRQIEEQRFDDARATLQPVAFAPHGGKVAERAQKVIEMLEAGASDELDAALEELRNPPKEEGEDEEGETGED